MTAAPGTPCFILEIYPANTWRCAGTAMPATDDRGTHAWPARRTRSTAQRTWQQSIMGPPTLARPAPRANQGPRTGPLCALR